MMFRTQCRDISDYHGSMRIVLRGTRTPREDMVHTRLHVSDAIDLCHHDSSNESQ